MGRKEDDKRRAPYAVMDVLSSTRTAVVLISTVAVAAVVGTISPYPVAQKYVYGHLWFHILLGLLGLNLIVCIFWRKRIGLARIWSLLTHSGILLVLVGAIVTLILAERGQIVIREGQELKAFVLEGRPRGAEPTPLGFALRLLDFRITRYPPVDRLLVMRSNAAPVVLRVVPGRELDVPGAECRLSGVRFMPEEGDGVVEVAMPGGTKRQVAATVGTTQVVDQDGLSLRILRYEPSFKIDRKTKEVSSDSTEPDNPVVQVALVRDGTEEEPHWLFARVPSFGHTKHGAREPAKVKMRYLHPRFPVLTAEAETPSGVLPVRLENGRRTPSPWDPALVFIYERRAGPPKEYESEVEVLQDGRVVAHHVIRVNDPLVYEGTKLAQSGYDKENLRYTVLGVSRDSGVWFVYAGFLTMMVGIVGRFYVSPLLRQMRAPAASSGRLFGPDNQAQAKGGNDGSS